MTATVLSFNAKLVHDYIIIIIIIINYNLYKFKYLLFELVNKYIPATNKYIPATKSYDNGRMKKPIWMSHKALKAVKRKKCI